MPSRRFQSRQPCGWPFSFSSPRNGGAARLQAPLQLMAPASGGACPRLACISTLSNTNKHLARTMWVQGMLCDCNRRRGQPLGILSTVSTGQITQDLATGRSSIVRCPRDGFRWNRGPPSILEGPILGHYGPLGISLRIPSLQQKTVVYHQLLDTALPLEIEEADYCDIPLGSGIGIRRIHCYLMKTERY